MIVLESLRRLLVTGCLLTGVFLLLMPGPELFAVGVEDFARSKAENPFFSAPGGESLEDFVRRRTAGRALHVSDEEWVTFIESIVAGRPPNALQRLEQRDTVRWVFGNDAIPAVTADHQQDLLYVSGGSELPWLRIERLAGVEIDGVEARWRYPGRTYGFGLLALALGLYRVIPSQKPQAGRLVYARLQAVVLGDWLGFAGMSASLALYLFLHQQNLPGQSVPAIHDGWWLLLLVCSVLVAGFFLLVLIGLHYATLSMCVTPVALEIRSWRGLRAYPWALMQQCTSYHSRRGSRIAALLGLLAPGPAAFGQGRLLAGNEEWGVEIVMRDGDSIRIMGNAFPGFNGIVSELQAKGVPGSAALQSSKSSKSSKSLDSQCPLSLTA
jgi:hypothetical protein